LRSRSSMKSLAMVLVSVYPVLVKRGGPPRAAPRETRGSPPGPALSYFAPSFFAM
jgi:hypothetical protein